MDQLISWLPAHIPESARDAGMTRIVHGDYRLDNLMFHPSEPRVLAVLDWELSTLGHPLADFSYHCMAWHIPPGSFRGIGGLDVQSLGIPTEDAYIRRYCERTGLTTPEALAVRLELLHGLQHVPHCRNPARASPSAVEAASSAQAASSAAGARPWPKWRGNCLNTPEQAPMADFPPRLRPHVTGEQNGFRLFTPYQGTSRPGAALHGRTRLSGTGRFQRRDRSQYCSRKTLDALQTIENLKPKAQAAGLWNLFLPFFSDLSEYGGWIDQRRVCSTVRDHGPGFPGRPRRVLLQ